MQLVHVWQTLGTVDRPVNRTREQCSLFLGGRLGGRPAREPLLSGSEDGRPVAASGQKVTVGRSTGSSFLAEFAANGYIFLGAINTPLMACFL